MREFSKTYIKIWDDDKFLRLGRAGRDVFHYLLASPHSNVTGCFRISLAMIAEDLREDIEWVSEGFRNCSETVLIKFDNRSKVVWIVSWYKYNKIPNPNVAKFALKVYDLVPDCDVKACSIKDLLDSGQPAVETIRKQLRNRFETITQTVRQTVTQTSPEQREREREREPAAIAARSGEIFSAAVADDPPRNGAELRGEPDQILKTMGPAEIKHPDAACYDLAKELFGRKGGALATDLLKVCKRNGNDVMSLLYASRSKSNGYEYLRGVIYNRQHPDRGNGNDRPPGWIPPV